MEPTAGAIPMRLTPRSLVMAVSSASTPSRVGMKLMLRRRISGNSSMTWKASMVKPILR